MISVSPAYLHWGLVNLKFDVVANAKSGKVGPLVGTGETETLKGSAILTGSSGRGFSKRLQGGGNTPGVGGSGGLC